jgi:hypothetical protein
MRSVGAIPLTSSIEAKSALCDRFLSALTARPLRRYGRPACRGFVIVELQHLGRDPGVMPGSAELLSRLQ